MMENFKLDLIAAELEEARIRPGGFEALRYQRFAPTLISYFHHYEKRLSQIDTEIGRSSIVHAAVAAASAAPPITAHSLRTAIDTAAASHLRRIRNDYVIATQITMQLPQARTARLAQSTIVVGPDLPKQFAKAAASATSKTPAAGKQHPPQGSWWCRVRVSARTPPEAQELAERELDSLRGIWIWHLSSGRFRWSSGHRYPLSPIVTGPVVTPHWPPGHSVDTSGGWLRIGYSPPQRPYAPSVEEWRDVIRFERQVRKALRRLPEEYRDELWRCLQRYASALDDTDWESTALKLWGVLEALTGVRRHSDVVRRAAAVFRDVELHQAVLDHLRIYRNRVAHEGHWSRDAETIVCELKSHVEALLSFHASRGHHYANLAEATVLLDLCQHRRHLRQAVKYFSK